MFDKCLFFTLNSLTRRLNRLWEEEFEKVGLSPQHAYLLRLAIAHPGITQKEMGEKLDLAPSTVTRFIDSLQKENLIKRTCCSNDGRAMIITATKKGEALQAKIDHALQTLGDSMYATLGEKNLRELVEVVNDNRKRFAE